MSSNLNYITRDEVSCRTCRHYQRFSDRLRDEHANCLRHAPRPVTSESEDDALILYPSWPLVHRGDICGEWQWDTGLDKWIDNPEENPRA
jgi:hypothetical protein